MPGLLGIIGQRDSDDARRRFDAGFARLARHRHTTGVHAMFEDGRWRLGQVTLDRDPRQRDATLDEPTAVLFHGELLGGPTDVSGNASAHPASQVAVLHKHHGAHLFDRLRGSFAVAIVDTTRRRVILATDHVGTHPIYWRHDADGLSFSSDLSALIRATSARPVLDLEAVADYLTYGAVVGEKTLVRGTAMLAPGSVLEYDADNGHVTISTYAPLEDLFHGAGASQTEAQYHEAVRAAFAASVSSTLAGPRRLGLSLSGGLDSRAILSTINGRAAGLLTYTLGVAGCADEVIAERLSAIAGTSHHFFELNDSYLRDFLPNLSRMVSATDGMYLSHGLTEILALDFVADTGIEVLLRGHGGELAKTSLAWPLHTDARVHAMHSLGELVPYLSARANYITPQLPLTSLLTPDAAAAAGAGTRTSFGALLEGTRLSPAQACSYLYLRELTRRFTIPSIELFRTRIDVRLPFLDVEFLRTLLSGPAPWRDTTALHQFVTAAGVPALLKVRNSNTGAPGNASPAMERVLDKVNSLMKRLNVRGYRHYHSFDAWMRRMLLESVEAELLGASARVQSFVRRDALQAVIRDTRAGTADHGYLLQILLILELWQRENGVEAAA